MANEFPRAIWVGWPVDPWSAGVEEFAVNYTVEIWTILNGVSGKRWDSGLLMEWYDDGDDWIYDDVFGIDDGTFGIVRAIPAVSTQQMKAPNSAVTVKITAPEVQLQFDPQEDSFEIDLDWAAQLTI